VKRDSGVTVAIGTGEYYHGRFHVRSVVVMVWPWLGLV